MSDAETHAIAAVFQDAAQCIALFASVRPRIEALGVVELRVTRTQVAFRAARRQFAWTWRPARWTGNRPEHSIVVSFALDTRVDDARIVEATAIPSDRWMHHIVVEREADIDDTVMGWLEAAYAAAAGG